MVFSSLQFLFLFLPLTIIGYHIVDVRYKNIFLLIASLGFYAWGEPKFVFIMLLACLINWGLAIGIEYFCERKGLKNLFLVIGISVDVGLLVVFKYLNFITYNISHVVNISVTQIVLPIGISFFTFQIMSYIIDVYRNPRVYICRSLADLCLYITFFPQLIAGPIVRYNTIMQQIKERMLKYEQFQKGIERFIIGLTKKVVVSNNMATVADKAFALGSTDLSVGFAWLGAFAYTFQIYFDFSGYSDMAIGLGKMFGFEFEENFNYPYIAGSVTDFWRRWHISLSSWFRSYVYLPLGGDGRGHNKGKRWLQFRNLFIVWLLTGIWHGAQWTFVLWGMGYFFLLVVEKYLVKPEARRKAIKLVWRLVTMFSIVLLWVVFRANNMEVLFRYLKAMFGFSGNVFVDGNFYFYFREYVAFYIIAIIGSGPIVQKVKDWICNVPSFLVQIIKGVVLSVFFLSVVSYLVMGYHNPFIYFNF